jgi:hypothetical protein
LTECLANALRRAGSRGRRWETNDSGAETPAGTVSLPITPRYHPALRRHPPVARRNGAQGRCAGRSRQPSFGT